MAKLCLIVFCLFCVLNLYSQEAITEANYLKQDSILWADFTLRQQELEECWNSVPDKRDSIKNIFDGIFNEASQKNIELAIKYASTPSGLQRLFMTRLRIPKDTLNGILDSLGPDMRESLYGRCIMEHIRTRQIEEGDSLWRFPCVQQDGEDFDWSVTDGKRLLVLYGGLGCMGKNGRDELERLYNRTLRDDLLILVYWPCSSLAALQEIKAEYPYDYIFVSDFMQDASPMKIRYGVQATPTCFFTDRRHIVKVKCEGLDMKRIDKCMETE